MQPEIVIIDYGVGNTHSVKNAIGSLGYKVKISSSKSEISNAGALILPGVGAFGIAMENLKSSGLKDFLDEEVLLKKKPILGICLGMQLLATCSSEDGYHEGFNWINGEVVKMNLPADYSVPHVGWNDLKIDKPHPLFDKLDASPNFYFDHSYHFICDPQHVAATCNYGKELTAAVRKNNIFGVQFHPEKSQVTGLKLFRGFLNSIFLV
jgi:imidazole glycerol-phosphate synthase subunit HisH